MLGASNGEMFIMIIKGTYSKYLFLQRRLLLIFFVLSVGNIGICGEPSQKIHPFFQMMLGRVSQPAPKEFQKSSNGSPEVFSAILFSNNFQEVRRQGIHLNTEGSSFATARLTLSQIQQLAQLDAVQYIRPASINYIQTDVSVPEIGASLVQNGIFNNTPYRGAGAIILIYDTGIDWKRFDFRQSDTTKSRILAIWDQTLTPQNGERSPDGFDYGVEYLQSEIDDELDGIPADIVREKDINGHGTHLAGIAAGNGITFGQKYVGVAPETDIIVVKGGDKSFDEASMIDGLTYAEKKAREYGKPVVVNWSIGGQYGAHDGTSPYEVAVDSFSATPGRVVCIAAGNDAKFPIHTSGSLSKNSSISFNLIQPPYIPSSDSLHHFFDFMIWFQGDVSASGKNALVATVRSPSGITYSCSKDSFGTASDSSDGFISLFNYKATENDHRCIELYVQHSAVAPPKVGTWNLTVTTSQSTSIEYDAWITVRAGAQDIPYLSLENGDNQKTVTLPGTSRNAITVGSYVTKWKWPCYDGNTYLYDVNDDRTSNISIFSGIGPTRDGRIKPELTAPGQGITAALSSSIDVSSLGNQLYWGGSYKIDLGTSQATPHVTGAVAVLLGIQPTLNSAEIKSLLTSSARSDDFASSLPNATWGYGKLDLLNCVAKLIGNLHANAVRRIIRYDSQGNGQPEILTGNSKIALRFTTPISGIVTGFNVSVPSAQERAIVGNGNLQCGLHVSDNNIPTTQISASVFHPLYRLNPITANYVQMLDAGVTVEEGKDYCLVLSLSTPTDSLRILTDGKNPAERSLVFTDEQWKTADQGEYKIQVIITSLSGISKVVAENVNPKNYKLYNNYPNPFNPTTSIEYQLPEAAKITMTVYDILGREVVQLVNGEVDKGHHAVTFDGAKCASGIYFVRMTAQGNDAEPYVKTMKIVLMK